MNPEVLEKVLSCHKLPSLPAVAMRVVELTQDQKVSMRALAETIQNDQALTAKILKTVNSSLFGLRQKCSSINQAIIMLGMSAVKTLALGFSLVTAIKDSTQEFDLRDHWRRSLFTAVAAKAIAARAGIANPEEAFLGGLLQDLGVVALQQTLGAEYVAAVAPAPPPPAPAPPRLKGFLEDEIRQKLVSVDDRDDRSVITIRGDGLFASGAATVKDAYLPVLGRIATELKRVPGEVLVTGHSDNKPIATLRFPSNWKLSQARAESVLELLARDTGQPLRFTAEGKADTEPVAPNDTNDGRAQNRRVEITLFAPGVR